MPSTNSKSACSISLAELADKVGADLDGDGSIIIDSVAPITAAAQGAITFVANSAYEKFIPRTEASAIILKPDFPPVTIPSLRHKLTYLTYARAVDLLFPISRRVPAGIHPSASIAETATIDATVGIGPLSVISAGSSIGQNSQLISGIHIGERVSIGEDCLIYPGVKIMDDCQIGNGVILHPGVVIGSDGFGFAESETGLKKIQQIGWVEIADLVEIGANTTIDRGALGPTKIGFGTKIDNLVQVAHNVEIGEHTIIVAQVGISGSTKIGRGVVLGGQVGMVGHIEIGDGAQVAAQSGISKSVEPGAIMFGSPARPIGETKRIEASLKRLPELLKRVKKLEDKLDNK